MFDTSAFSRNMARSSSSTPIGAQISMSSAAARPRHPALRPPPSALPAQVCLRSPDEGRRRRRRPERSPEHARVARSRLRSRCVLRERCRGGPPARSRRCRGRERIVHSRVRAVPHRRAAVAALVVANRSQPAVHVRQEPIPDPRVDDAFVQKDDGRAVTRRCPRTRGRSRRRTLRAPPSNGCRLLARDHAAPEAASASPRSTDLARWSATSGLVLTTQNHGPITGRGASLGPHEVRPRPRRRSRADGRRHRPGRRRGRLRVAL